VARFPCSSTKKDQGKRVSFCPPTAESLPAKNIFRSENIPTIVRFKVNHDIVTLFVLPVKLFHGVCVNTVQVIFQ
jgi:hypothetical protein